MQLDQLLKAMWSETEAKYKAANDSTVKKALFRNLDYLLVASRLLNPEKKSDPLPDGQYQEEMELIMAAGGFDLSPIFQYEEDYSQYKPRGHYTRSDSLKRYFRSMMWLGRMTFSCVDQKSYSQTMTLSAILLNQVMAALKVDGRPAMDVWNDIYQPTVFFVGKSDDINFQTYLPICYDVYGKSFPSLSPDTFADTEKLFEFLQATTELQPARITYPGQPKKGFRFMGQRFIPDSWILDELVMTKIPGRAMPTGLDVMIVLDPEKKARQSWPYQYLGPADKNNSYYVSKLDTLKTIFQHYPGETWAQNAYWNWLYCFMPLLMPKGEGYPFFMQTDAWRDKDLHAALASWAELRHDTILYAKQSGTETGVPPAANLMQGYVEPNPHFFGRIASLAEFMIKGLESRHLLFDEFQRSLQRFAGLAGTLKTIAEKELTGVPVTSDEYLTIFNIGKTLYDIVTFQPYPSEGPMPWGDSDLEPMPVIADVHTDALSGTVLEEAVGYPYALYVLCSIEGRPVLTKGAGFSYYEFIQPLTNRLTDEQWRDMLAKGTEPGPPSWISSFYSDADDPLTTEFYIWQKPQENTLNVVLNKHKLTCEDTLVAEITSTDWQMSDVPNVVLIHPDGSEQLIPVEKQNQGLVWTCTIVLAHFKKGTYFLDITKGVEKSSLHYRTHFVITSGASVDRTAPSPAFQLSQNYPNPFNPLTTITFNVSRPTRVNLTVYDLSGRMVKTLLDDRVSAGPHTVVWDGTDAENNPVASGVYFYRLQQQNGLSPDVLMKKLTLLR